jgi:hypothetical protein
MEDNGTSLDSVFNGQPESQPSAATAAPEPNQTDAGVTASPPEAKQADPNEGFRAAALDERRKRQELERELAELRKQQTPKQPEPAPNPQQFASQEEYLDAVAERKAQQVLDAALQRLTKEQAAAVEQQQASADREEMLAAGKAKYADFDHVVRNNDVPITEVMVHAMLALNDGHEVAYHLGKNPAEAARIARLPASSQAREIGKLAKSVAAPAPAPEMPSLPKTLTQTRSAGGQFTNKTWPGPTPLDQVTVRRK